MHLKNTFVPERLREAGVRRADRASRGRELPARAEASCPTCLLTVEDGAGAAAAADGEARRPGEPAPRVCPACGISSVEWAMTCEIDGLLRDMTGFDLLDAALGEPDVNR